MRHLLIAGGTQAQLARLLAKIKTVAKVTTVTSQESPRAWGKAARHADAAVLRVGWMSHNHEEQVRNACPVVVRVSQKGDDALLAAVERLEQQGGL